MKNINISLSKPYRRPDDTDVPIQQVTLSADFENQHEALKFMSEVNALIINFTNNAPTNKEISNA